MTCLAKVLLLYLVEHAFSCGYNHRIWAIFPGSDQEMPAIITSVFTDTFEVVWEESRWYDLTRGGHYGLEDLRRNGNNTTELGAWDPAVYNNRVDKSEDARDELGPCKTISGGPSLDDEGSSSDETDAPVSIPFTAASPDGNSGLPTAVLIPIVGGGLVLFFGAVYFCMRSSSKLSDSPTNRTMGRPVAEAPLDIDELGSKITKPSAVRTSGKAAEEPLSVRTTPRLPVPGEGPAVVVRVGVGIWLTQSSGSSAFGNTTGFAPDHAVEQQYRPELYEKRSSAHETPTCTTHWCLGRRSSGSFSTMEYRQLKGILTEQKRRSSIDVANLRGDSSASLGSGGLLRSMLRPVAVFQYVIPFMQKALVRVLSVGLAIPSVLGCRYNERVRAVFQRTGEEMSAIVLNVYQDTLEVVWEEARWYCNIQGNDKSHCIVKKTEARNAQGEYCRQPSVGSGTDGDGDFDGGGAELGPSGDGGLSTVIVVVIIAASVLVFCGCIYLCIRRSAESLDLSSPKNGAAYKLGRGFTETISRMLKENDEVKPVVKDAENPHLPEVTPRISVTPSHLDVRASSAKGEPRPNDASRKSSAAISGEEMQQIRDAAAALAGAQTLATEESSNVSYRNGGASVSVPTNIASPRGSALQKALGCLRQLPHAWRTSRAAADVLILPAFTTVVAACRPVWWGIQKGLGGTP
ncbi:hypothetical protein FOZ62_002387 [Perkinsus olseni]|uniref:Uncharacterized protein n=1 Tax=Perkinsus olseni TaxID=32597 RepID=A0A7J6S6G2_PEROL|nr:hypothetical protein FOZ62_002387 [Perkinsus olseni]